MEKIGKKIVLLFSFLITVTSTVFGQKPSVQLSVNKKPIEVGQSVAFTVKSNFNGQVSIQLPEQFLQGGTMNGMEQTMDNSGAMVTSIFYTQEGVFKKDGKYTIVATVKEKNKTHKSNTLTIQVRKKADPSSKKGYASSEEDITKHNLKQPMFGIIQKSSQKVYEGEPLILEAKVFSRLNISMMQNYKSFTLKGAAETFDLEKTDNLALNRENYQGNTFLTFSCGKQLVFPSSTGKYIIKPFSMVLRYNNGGFFDNDAQLESNATFIDVLPLPKGAPSDYIGAVGKYELKTKIFGPREKIDDIFTVEMLVSGTGNLHSISKPKINLPKGLDYYGDPEISEELDYTEEGVTGFKKFVYHIKIQSGGNYQLPNLSISYFDPSLKKYVTIRDKGTNFSIDGKIEGNEIASIDSSIVATPDDEVLTTPNILNQKTTAQTNQFPYLWACIIVLLLLVIFLAVRNRKLHSMKDQKETIQAETNFEEIEKEQPMNPFQDVFKQAREFANEWKYNEAYTLIYKELSKIIMEQSKRQTDAPIHTLDDALMQLSWTSEEIVTVKYLLKISEEVAYFSMNHDESWGEFNEKLTNLQHRLDC